MAQDERRVNCAIYTRKPTDEGLDQTFNTLDAQREAGEAYVASQRHEGWSVLPQRYDGGGYTGANMDRPALKRLLDDVKAGLVNCVVVYKVGRPTLSILPSFTQFEREMIAAHPRGYALVSPDPTPSRD